MVEVHAQLTVQAFGVVPAHAVSMNLGSCKPGEESQKRFNGHTFSSQQNTESPFFTPMSSSSQ